MSPSPTKPRVLVAMSGGVDSSVAAALLVDQGWDAVGVTLHLWDYPDDGSVRGRCCAPEDQHDARRVADRLGIPHFSFDRREAFLREVVTPFVDQYLAGETPSPCVACNKGVKMRELFALADRLGAEKVATGHYARVLTDPSGRATLAAATDASKDQSYFLHAIPARELSRLVLPLGELTKPQVRARALALDLPGAAKGESQELCFVPTGRYDAFVEARAGGRVRPGPILDAGGRQVGTHEGVHRFTVGQRKGTGVALGERAFVTSVDGVTGVVRLGSAAELEVNGLDAEDACFADDAPEEFDARVKVRARHEGELARVRRLEGGRVEMRFERPVRAANVGQFAVVYIGDRVIGGARIAGVQRGEA